MRVLILIVLILANLFSAELILISNDSTKLESLAKKYKQTLLINNNFIYLIPKACKLERYFGGESEGTLALIQNPEHTDEIIITQEVFEAKQTQDIQDKITVEKDLALIEGKEAKEFLDDDEGRGYGGASEIAIDFSFQTMQAKKEFTTAVKKHKPIINDTKIYMHPQCELLDDGSGYQLFHIEEAQFYIDTHLSILPSKLIYFN